MLNTVSTYQTLFRLFEDAFAELIQSYTGEIPPMEHSAADSIDANMTSVVGLSSKDLSASVAVVTSTGSIESLSDDLRTCPEDWLGEFANQLAGRLKNKMNRFGLSPRLSTPTTLQGHHLQVVATCAHSVELTARFDYGTAIAQLTLKIEPTLQLCETSEDCVLEEGCLELF